MLSKTLAVRTALSAFVLSSSLCAQAGPGWIDQDAATPGIQPYKPSTYFTGTPGGTSGPKTLGDSGLYAVGTADHRIAQVSTGKGMGGLAAGEFHMCFTVYSLSTVYGATGTGQQVAMGKVSWNSGSPVFTPNTMANNMNTTGNVFGLMIDGTGLYAAVDWPAGAVLSRRTNNSAQFPSPVVVTGITGTYIDPAPAHLDGKLVLFYVNAAAGNIVYAPITETLSNGQLTAAAAGTAVNVITISGQISHSPTPLFGSNNDVLGLWFASRTGNDSDMYFASNIKNPAVVKCFDNASWINNGGVAGGRFLAADFTDYNRLIEGQGYYLMSNTDITVGAGAVLRLRTGGLSGTPSLNTSTLAVSLGVSPPVPLPGILGEFGLNPTPLLLLFGGPTSTSTDDTAEITLPATDTALKGITLHFQGVIRPTDTNLTGSFTSTTSVSFN